MTHKTSRQNPKVAVSSLHLYRQPNKKGYEKFVFFFCVKSGERCYFPGSSKVFLEERVKAEMEFGDEFWCQFDEGLYYPGTEFEDRKIWNYTGNLLSMVLDAETVEGNLPISALAYLRKTMVDRTYSLKKLKEIEDEFVCRQVEFLKKREQKFQREFE